jgi:hypothetical protein
MTTTRMTADCIATPLATWWHLTFEMSGSTKAQPLGCPLDRGVRCRLTHRVHFHRCRARHRCQHGPTGRCFPDLAGHNLALHLPCATAQGPTSNTGSALHLLANAMTFDEAQARERVLASRMYQCSPRKAPRTTTLSVPRSAENRPRGERHQHRFAFASRCSPAAFRVAPNVRHERRLWAGAASSKTSARWRG